MRVPACSLAAVSVLLIVATPASAGRVEVERSPIADGPSPYTYTLVYTASPGESNDLAVNGTRLRDSGAPLEAGPGCVADPDGSVVCDVPPRDATGARFVTGDGDDRVDIRDVEALVETGDGNDTIVTHGMAEIDVNAGGGADVVRADPGANRTHASYWTRRAPVYVTVGGGADDGEPGEGDDIGAVHSVGGGQANDTLAFAAQLSGWDGDDRLIATAGGSRLDGGRGNDELIGADGPDVFWPGSESDVMSGGGGQDRVEYFGGTGVRVTLDGRADDGAPGERDNVGADVEDVLGSYGDDTIIGSPSRNAIDGDGGNDTISGGAGDDLLTGGPGFNLLDGGAAADTFRSSTLDRIDARDNARDALECDNSVFGGGRHLIGDAADALGAGCTTLPHSLRGARVRADSKGRATLELGCPPANGRACTGVAALTRAGAPRPAASRSYRIAAGGRATVRVQLPAATVRQLKRAKKLVFTATGITTDPDAVPGRRSVFPPLTVLRPR